MDHGVAVGADGAHLLDRVNLIALANFRQRLEVVDVDEPCSPLSVDCLEVETAGGTSCPMMGDAFFTGRGVSFISVHGHADPPALGVSLLGGLFIREIIKS
jgi:hypothetical protein